MSRPAVNITRPVEGTGRKSSETKRSPPTSKFSPHYHSRDDFYALQQKMNSAQGTTISRPETASPEQRAAKQPSSAGALKKQGNPTMSRPPPSQKTTGNPIKPETMVIGMALGSPRDYPVPPIGTALGSPRDNPLPQLPKEARYVSSNLNPKSPYSRPAIPVEGPRSGHEDIKHKGGWKMFGGLFSRTPAPSSPVSPFYDLHRHSPLSPSPLSQSRGPASPHPQITITRTTQTSHQQQQSSGNDSLASEGTKRNVLSKKQKAETRPGMQRSGTVPQYRNDRRTPSPRPIQHRTEYTPSAALRSQPLIRPTLLQVEIPDVSMERYSVMFSDVLKLTQPRQSLMLRRQAQLKELNIPGITKKQSDDPKPDNTFLLPVRPATSPTHQPQSPSFSLFPSARPAKRIPSPLSLNKPTTLHRSATAPPGSVSPARAAFELSKPSIQENSNQSVPLITSARSSEASNSTQTSKWSSRSDSTQPSPISESDSERRKRELPLAEPKAVQSAQSRPPAPITADTSLRAVHAQLQGAGLIRLAESPLDNVARDILHRTASTSHNANQTLSPPTTTTTTTTTTTMTRAPSTTRQPPTNRYIHTPASHTPNPPANYATRNPLSSSPPSAAEISVARQISVSRRMKKEIVVPVGQKPVGEKMGTRVDVPKTTLALVPQPVRATLVQVDREWEGGERGEGAGGRAVGHVSRKSHHVLVETV
ncbi:hypothetical protein MMC30_000360 [Trapelia coarctata]|nr:hypothetical protein [Trapelia coarctata]